MHVLHISSSIRKTFNVQILSVAVTWLLGLLVGIFFLNQTSFASLMYSVCFLRVSIIGLFLSLTIPLLLSYILLLFLHVYFVLPLVFLKAFTFICSYGGLMIAFGNAGWLVSGMILFSDFFLVVWLLFLWYSVAAGEKSSSLVHTALYFIIPILFGCFDYFAVSPYVAMLLNY